MEDQWCLDTQALFTLSVQATLIHSALWQHVLRQWAAFWGNISIRDAGMRVSIPGNVTGNIGDSVTCGIGGSVRDCLRASITDNVWVSILIRGTITGTSAGKNQDCVTGSIPVTQSWILDIKVVPEAFTRNIWGSVGRRCHWKCP